MKIIVINFSGNVGKSIVAQHLLKPRIKNSAIIAVESINSDGTQDEKMKGKAFTDIMDKAMEQENVIIDVGASNVEEFLNQMKKSIGSHEDFDYFVVPTINRHKQIEDTDSTLLALADLGIEQDRIRVVFNMLDDDINIAKAFDTIMGRKDKAVINTSAVIFENELFNRLNETDFKTIADIVADDTDYKQLISQTEESDSATRRKYSRALGLRRLAIGVKRMLDNTYQELFRV
ncbi:StbB (plasmid) [Plesiomonas shigelloides]|uniref:StbB family protein n=1 Tax=Plesiomonas shigelloides TaxID=703 RepID=UPI000D1229E2|nr:StbB family protein [Plesiomonas shigelloides]AVQ89156.1 StbB [Plesiomonas shigelloides]